MGASAGKEQLQVASGVTANPRRGVVCATTSQMTASTTLGDPTVHAEKAVTMTVTPRRIRTARRPLSLCPAQRGSIVCTTLAYIDPTLLRDIGVEVAAENGVGRVRYVVSLTKPSAHFHVSLTSIFVRGFF